MYLDICIKIYTHFFISRSKHFKFAWKDTLHSDGWSCQCPKYGIRFSSIVRWEILWNPRYLLLDLGLFPYPSHWTCASDIGRLCKHDLHFFPVGMSWGWRQGTRYIWCNYICYTVTHDIWSNNLHNKNYSNLWGCQLDMNCLWTCPSM